MKQAYAEKSNHNPVIQNKSTKVGVKDVENHNACYLTKIKTTMAQSKYLRNTK